MCSFRHLHFTLAYIQGQLGCRNYVTKKFGFFLQKLPLGAQDFGDQSSKAYCDRASEKLVDGDGCLLDLLSIECRAADDDGLDVHLLLGGDADTVLLLNSLQRWHVRLVE